MRYVPADIGDNSRLFPYVYSFSDGDNVRFLIEVFTGTKEDENGVLRSTSTVRVLSMDGEEVARFTDGENDIDFYFDPASVHYRQLNALMFFTSQENEPFVLKFDGRGKWTFEPWKLKHYPWRFVNEKRDFPIVVSCSMAADGNKYSVVFDSKEKETESEIKDSDVLRASYWLEQQEATAKGFDLRRGVIITDSLQEAKKGDRIAVRGDTTNTYWVCKQEWPSDVYVDGLDDPGSYPDNFIEPENLDGFDSITPVASVLDVGGGSIGKGTKFAIKSGYWEYYTCIRDFTKADMTGGGTTFADYPGFFVRGLVVGEPLTCRGKWEFYCSGLWYGSYEVRKCYDTGELSGEWEPCGTSFSRLGEAGNTQLTGDESEEECYMRLFLTRSKYLKGTIDAGFPPDSCGNRLIVPGYRHDMVLRAVPIYEDNEEEAVAVEWLCEDVVKIDWEGRRTVMNWSWGAFSARYGFPLQVDVYNQRLVFASTIEQPQTVWMSRIDDFNNFSTGDSDDAALALTMSTTSQNPICWMMAQSHRLLIGTSEAEWVISAGSNQGSISTSNAQIEEHGHVGSEPVPAVAAIDRLLYIERGGGRCYEYGYSFEIDGYRSKDLTVFAPHVLRDHGGVLQGTMLRKPDTVAVFALADGQIALCTYNTMHEVNAWHRWVTDGDVLSVCAMPDGTRSDRLFLIVKRERYEAGDCVYRAYNIEVIDDDSPFDDIGNDYESVLVTNALGNPLEAQVAKTPKLPSVLLLGSECMTDSLQVSNDGETWTSLTTNDPVLPAGWREILTINKWEYENVVGLRYSGPTSCHFLAVQG